MFQKKTRGRSDTTKNLIYKPFQIFWLTDLKMKKSVGQALWACRFRARGVNDTHSLNIRPISGFFSWACGKLVMPACVGKAVDLYSRLMAKLLDNRFLPYYLWIVLLPIFLVLSLASAFLRLVIRYGSSLRLMSLMGIRLGEIQWNYSGKQEDWLFTNNAVCSSDPLIINS